MNADALAQGLQRAWQRQRGVSVVVGDVQRLSAGASAQTWAFTADEGEDSYGCVVQLFGGGDNFVGALDKTGQARVQQHAAQHGVRTPEVVLIVGEADGLPEGFASRRVDGETLGRRVVADARYAGARRQLVEDCAQQLAAIHALDVAPLQWLPLRDTVSQLQVLAQTHRDYGESLPVFEAAFAWLARRVPACAAPRLVHGDFRTGNLAVDARGLAAIFDWELAHRGDPMEDLGWLCMRSWRFGADRLQAGGFATRADFYAAYERASGRRVDPHAVRFWETLGTLKWGIICQWFADRHARGAVTALEPAVIGRRVSETELQLLELMEGHAD